LTSAAERLLADAPWAGNVRELRNVLERACILTEAEILTETDLAGVMEAQADAQGGATGRQRRAAVDAPAPLEAIAREHIIKTLERVGGNKAVAARLLGISRRAFYRQLEKHGLHERVPGGARSGPPRSMSESAA
jgi:DNA-binding NtrC family response regulator